MIFDHIVLNVTDTIISKKFYLNALFPLGITLIKEEEGCVGFGTNNKASFWICNDGEVQRPMHIAFIAPDRSAIDAFYHAAMLAGGIDNGSPGLRKNYHVDYYSAFVFDPDGHNIEAVCRQKFP